MNKINTKSIVFSLKMLSFLVFSLLIIPTAVFATPGYVDNPTPQITSISPNSIKNNSGDVVITITGNGFIPSSIARVNGSERPTTFIDYSHLLIKLNSNDTYKTNEFYINVFNGFPGGGYSNAELFTVGTKTTTVAPSAKTNQTENIINTDNTDKTNNTDKDFSNLTATALFGSNGFLPSGLMQWVLFAIVILLIIILVRRISGAEAKYNKAPMKTL